MEEYIDVLEHDDLICRIWYNTKEKKVKFENYSQDYISLPFGKKTKATYNDFLDFLEDRCFPEGRVNRKALLASIDLSIYRPLDIVKKTHGVMIHDFVWLRFKGERLSFDNVKVRD